MCVGRMAPCGEVLERWHLTDELLRQLGEYVVSVIKVMGPSFLELVAEDIGMEWERGGWGGRDGCGPYIHTSVYHENS